MAKSKIDAKEFMLQYGDRIGLGIAGLLAFLFVLFAFLGSGSGVSAEQVRESSKKADEAIKRSEINPEKIALKDEPTVKPLNQIDELSKSLTKPIAMDQLHLPFRYFEQDPPRGNFRSNPSVMQALEVTSLPLVGAFRLYETRLVNNVEEAMVLTPRNAASAPKFGNQGNNNFNLGGQRGNPGGGLGTGAGGGLGAGAGGGLGAGGGSGGIGMDGGGKGGGKAGGAAGGDNKTKKETRTTEATRGGDESMYTFAWAKDIKREDLLGVTIRPLRSAFIAATYPHRMQTIEIAKKLQIQQHEVGRYYRRIDVQRRRIFLKGSQLPDGRIAEAEIVELENPRDRSKKEYKLLSEVDKLAATADDQMSEKERSALAGWDDVNIPNVAQIMMSAYSVSRFNNEGFQVEKEPIIEGLVEYAGPRMAMRLPKLVRGDYPDVISKLSILMGAVKKIKEDDKARIPPPPKDNRLSSPAGDEFDRLASDDKKESEKKTDAPEQSGQIPEFIPIRFIDVDLPTDNVGGATFEYRLRVVLDNPNYKQEKLVAAPEFAKDEVLNGAWSAPTRVTFEPDSMIFAGERERAKGSTDDREKDKVPVQLHKWLGKVETVDRSDRDYTIVGDWWIERLLVGRGEHIGRSPDLAPPANETNLVQWVSHALDTVQQKIGADVQKKTRTPDLYTNSILVDFEGGSYQSFRSAINNNNKKEDVPAEVLILEPDGRLIARHISEDRNDEGRKQRFDHWKTWIDKLAKPTDKKPAGN